MNITFLIGNGFDLNLGLKTRYTDFYEYYKTKVTDDMLSKAIQNDYELWKDLEFALGEILEDIDNSKIDEYLDSKALLEKYLLEYLEKEDAKFTITNNELLVEEFKKKVPKFYLNLNAKEKQKYENHLKHINASLVYQFINFNYTSTLDKIIDITKKDSKSFSTHICTGYNQSIADKLGISLHIHGDLNSGLILGVNDATQIKNSKLQDNNDLSSFIIKTNVNETLGELRQQNAMKMIDDSRYVCVYGSSLGDTDNIWWSYLVQWLSKNIDNRLIIFAYDESMTRTSAQEKVRFINKYRKLIVSKNNKIAETKKAEIINNIIVVPNSNIFDFKNIKVKDEDNGQT